jgi:hypothetical protein
LRSGGVAEVVNVMMTTRASSSKSAAGRKTRKQALGCGPGRLGACARPFISIMFSFSLINEI